MSEINKSTELDCPEKSASAMRNVQQNNQPSCCSKEKRHLPGRLRSTYRSTRSYVMEFREVFGCDATGCVIKALFARDNCPALTGIMIRFQRRLRLVLAEILVQVRVHAFVVILRRVIHCERIASSELDVDEYFYDFHTQNSSVNFFSLRNFNAKFFICF